MSRFFHPFSGPSPGDSLWILSPLLTYVGFFLALVLLAHLLRSQRTPASTMAWLLIILLVPYLGVPLYLLFGGRKMKRLADRKRQVYPDRHEGRVQGEGGAIERILRSYNVPPASTGNQVDLVTDGEEAYRLLIELIEGARSSIHITTYILGNDEVGTAIVGHLSRRARDGVQVRLLLDGLGSWRIGRRFLAPLTEAGARVALFMPVIHLPFRGRSNLRNHRKIAVVDGTRALTGGMNLAREYLGPAPLPTRWRDFSLGVTGPAATDLDDLFRSDWKFATGEDLAAPPAVADPPGGTSLQVVASGPDVAGDPLYESLVSVMFEARERIWIVTPYFVPDETLARALDLAARRGVEVHLILPAHSNHLTADLARASYLRQVRTSGAQVSYFQPVMVHAKVVVIDTRIAIIGSANMDMRSLFLNYEVALFLRDRREIEGIIAWVRTLLPQSVSELRTPGRLRMLAEDVVRLLSPLL